MIIYLLKTKQNKKIVVSLYPPYQAKTHYVKNCIATLKFFNALLNCSTYEHKSSLGKKKSNKKKALITYCT